MTSCWCKDNITYNKPTQEKHKKALSAKLEQIYPLMLTVDLGLKVQSRLTVSSYWLPR